MSPPPASAVRRMPPTVATALAVALIATLMSGVQPAAAAPAPASCTYAPELGTAADGSAQLNYRIAWTPAADENPADVLGYVIERRVGGQGSYFWRHRAPSGQTSWFDNKPGSAGTTLSDYRIRTRDQDRSFSPFVDCTLLDTERPSPPGRLDATDNGDGTIDATWRASTDDVAVATYRVFTDDNPAGNGLGVDTVLATATTNVLTAVPVPPGEYTTYLMAYDAAGNQSWRSGFTTLTVAAGAAHWHTAEIDGRWEIISPHTGEPVIWEAVNVRGDGLDRQPLDAADLERLARRFQYVRFVLHWDQMHPSFSSLDPVWVDRARGFLDMVAAYNDADDDPTNDIGVILDPVHLGGGAKNDFWIPDWAWRQGGFPENIDQTPQNSYLAWAGNGNGGYRVKVYLDLLREAGILTHPSVIAVEVVNEPHPRPGLSAVSSTAQWELSTTYAKLVRHIQAIQEADDAPTRLVVVGAYYGGNRHGGGPGAAENGGYSFNHARTVITENYGLDDVIWTAHNYFHGVGDDDGLDPEGRRGRGLWGDAAYGTGKGAGCYTTFGAPSIDTPWACDDPPSTPAIRAAHAANAAAHDRFAQAASMPFFMGEWGISRQRVFRDEYVGWDNASTFFCDKLGAYRDIDNDGTDVAISWAVWSFDAVIDDYGLYNSSENYRSESRLAMLEPNSWADAASNNRPFPTSAPYTGSWSGSNWGYAWPFTIGSSCRPSP